MLVPYSLLSVAPAACTDLSVRHAENKVQKVGVFFNADLSPQKHHVSTTISPRFVHQETTKNTRFSREPHSKKEQKNYMPNRPRRPNRNPEIPEP
jgi:hypothetical protein